MTLYDLLPSAFDAVEYIVYIITYLLIYIFTNNLPL